MKRLALVAGVMLLLFGIAGFLGLYAVAPAHSAIFAAVGLIGIMVGATRRRTLAPPRGSGHDLRDLT